MIRLSREHNPASSLLACRVRSWTPIAFPLAVCFALFLAPAAPAHASDLRAEIDRVLTEPALGSTRKSARVLDLGTGKVVYSYHAEDLLIPASNAKIITAAAALDRLGADFSFVTRFYAQGVVRDGTLEGDLVLWGNGDPNISGRFYDDDPLYLPRKWVTELRALGIKRVQGDLLIDDHAFDRVFRHPSWNPAESGLWYQAPVCALSFNDNCIDVLVRPGSPGARAHVSFRPSTSYLRLSNKLDTVASGPTAIRIDLNPSRTLTVAGAVRAGTGQRTMWKPVDQPALFLGTVVSEEFARQGGKISGRVRLADLPVVGRDRAARLLLEHRSTIAVTLAVMNKRSQNLYAENVLKTLGWKCFGRGTFPNGVRAVQDFLAELGFQPDEYVFADGSGLSRDARLSARIFTDVLAKMNREAYRDVFIHSLAEPGEGTLRKRFRGQDLGGRIFAKTGYVSGVSVLSGYVFSGSGRAFAFSVLMNDLPGSTRAAKSCQEEICDILCEQ